MLKRSFLDLYVLREVAKQRAVMVAMSIHTVQGQAQPEPTNTTWAELLHTMSGLFEREYSTVQN